MSSNAHFDWTKYVGMNDVELLEFLDGAELEEVRRRKLISYLYYRTMCKKHELELEEMMERYRESLVQRYGEEAVEYLEEAAVRNRRELDKIGRTEEYTRHLFDMDKLGECGERIHSLADNLNFKNEDVNAVGLAVMASDEASASVVERIIKQDDPLDDPEIHKYRIASAETMANLLKLYKEGHKEPLATMMKAGLLRCCQNFANCKDKTESVKWSGVIGDILDDLEKKPELIELCGFTEQELDAAHGAVVMGEIIKKGMKALNEYQDAALSGRKLTKEQEDEYSLAIIQMEMVFADREKQMEVLGGSTQMRPPSALQNHIGKNVTVEDARKGKVAFEAEKLRSKIRNTKVFKKIQGADMFERASTFSKNSNRRSIYRETINELEGPDVIKPDEISVNKQKGPSVRI